jgi:hypothetical protein
MGRAWFGSIRFRIFAVVAGLLLMSSLASVFLLRALLLDQLDAEIGRQLDAETEEVMLLGTATTRTRATVRRRPARLVRRLLLPRSPGRG